MSSALVQMPGEEQKWGQPAHESWFLTPFSTKRNQSSLEKWLILGSGRKCTKGAWSTLVVPINKCPKQHNYVDGVTSKEHRGQLNELPAANAGTIPATNKAVLDYNPKYKIQTHESIMI